MPAFSDQLGRAVHVDDHPQRIISLVPSITELICDLGCSDSIVGITKFCVHPDEVFRSRVRVGGTKDFKLDVIDSLSPDLIVGNKEENPKAAILKLAEKYPVWISDVSDTASSLDLIRKLGIVLDKQEKAEELAIKTEAGLIRLSGASANANKPTALYLIWKNPYMAAGTDTFISSMLSNLGLRNALEAWAEKGNRYPRMDEAQIVELSPDFIFLSTEPYPFKETDCGNLRKYCRYHCQLVDGEAFSWYGSRILKSIQYLENLSLSLRSNS